MTKASNVVTIVSRNKRQRVP